MYVVILNQLLKFMLRIWPGREEDQHRLHRKMERGSLSLREGQHEISQDRKDYSFIIADLSPL